VAPIAKNIQTELRGDDGGAYYTLVLLDRDTASYEKFFLRGVIDKTFGTVYWTSIDFKGHNIYLQKKLLTLEKSKYQKR
jgi:hypothetical protein